MTRCGSRLFFVWLFSQHGKIDNTLPLDLFWLQQPVKFKLRTSSLPSYGASYKAFGFKANCFSKHTKLSKILMCMTFPLT